MKANQLKKGNSFIYENKKYTFVEVDKCFKAISDDGKTLLQGFYNNFNFEVNE